MTDIKSRLIDGMRGQGIRLPDGDWLRLDDENLTLIADRLLSLPGIAIVELPTESWPHDYGRSFGTDVMTFKDRVLVGTDLDISPSYARDLAAALLAAAVQAQEEQPT